MRFTRKKITAVVATTAVVALGAGAAFAYWTTTGAGTGSGAAAAGGTALVVHQTSTPASALTPGGTAVALSGDFTNTNTFAVPITGVTATVVGSGGCNDFEIIGTAAGSTVPIGAHVGTWSGLSLRLNNTALNQDQCKTAVATITYATAMV